MNLYSGFKPLLVHMHFGLCYRPFVPLKLDSESRLPWPINKISDYSQIEIYNIFLSSSSVSQTPQNASLKEMG